MIGDSREVLLCMKDFAHHKLRGIGTLTVLMLQKKLRHGQCDLSEEVGFEPRHSGSEHILQGMVGGY